MVDAVITWVDGSDPAFIKQKRRFQDKELAEKKDVLNMGMLNTRFKSVGEVYYTVRLIRKNLDFVNIIYLVTNGQIPDFIDEEFKDRFNVKLVFHKQIFEGYESYLPTFCSRSIECMLGNIPSLSDEFLYFNDDVFVVNEMRMSDFKVGEKYLYRGLYRFKNIWLDRLHRALGWFYTRGTVGKRAESDIYPSYLFYFSPIHSPYIINKNFYKEAIESYCGIEEVIQYRFRNDKQPWPLGIYFNHLKNRGLLEFVYPRRCGYYHGEVDGGLDFTRFSECLFISAQSLDQASSTDTKNLFEFLDDKLRD